MNLNEQALHSIMERAFLQRNDYPSFDEKKSAITGFMKCYNEERLHGSLNYKTPEQFIKEFNETNFFEERQEINPLQLKEADLGGKRKLEKFNQINELCQNESDL